MSVDPPPRRHCPSCGMAECDRYHPYYEGDKYMVEFGIPREPVEYDLHHVIKEDLKNIIAKYTARGEMDVVAVYEQYLREHFD